MEEQLRCLSCGSPQSIMDLLDGRLRDWPPTGLLLADCPACGRPVELEIEDGRASVCELIGFGARPDVLVRQSVSVRDLSVERSSRARKIHYRGRTWLIGPRD